EKKTKSAPDKASKKRGRPRKGEQRIQEPTRLEKQIGGMSLQACRYLVIDFGTSKSPKSTRQRDNHYCPGRPASVPLRHTFVNSALATQHSLK
ncbi:hypothetical protein, partial [Thiolapillus sp.]|uniref:hypothetical protein n=1 Tax=Thiolapillus sp. TaxID=2017437 RepID=UPI003AF8F3DE